jgi:predicted ArsR family transcriptional regulator
VPARPRHAEVLNLLRTAGSALGVTEVAERLGIHANTARFHLDALTADGAAIRTLSAARGPGRPRAVTASAAVGRLTDLLDELGFDPAPAVSPPTVIRLRPPR